MLVSRALHLALLASAVLWSSPADGAPSAFKLCGRKLGEFMSRVCHTYNSPSWDVPIVVEQPAARRKRRVGIADECCTVGCTWEQINAYCAVSAYPESPLENLEAHMIADRSAEQTEGSAPAVAAATSAPAAAREVGRSSRGYGRARGRRRRLPCRCRRRRRAGRKRSTPLGNMNLIRNAVRAAPVVGTVSPLLTWGRTLNTDLPPSERDRYAYIAVYA